MFLRLFLVHKSRSQCTRPRRACTSADVCTSDDNRYEHGMTRKRHGNANTCRIAGAAKQRSNPWDLYTKVDPVAVQGVH
jgi:hypothetical protein